MCEKPCRFVNLHAFSCSEMIYLIACGRVLNKKSRL